MHWLHPDGSAFGRAARLGSCTSMSLRSSRCAPWSAAYMAALVTLSTAWMRSLKLAGMIARGSTLTFLV